MRRHGQFSSVLVILLTLNTSRAEESPLIAEARAHFKTGLAHAHDGDFGTAICDFEEAYRASPNYAVLYNLAQAYKAAGRHADAVRTLERYIHDGGKEIQLKRRLAVEDSIATERAKLGRLQLTVTPDATEVFIDGRRLGTAPFDIQEVEPGTHVISARLDGFVPVVQQVSLEASGTTPATLKLAPRAEALQVPFTPLVLDTLADSSRPAMKRNADLPPRATHRANGTGGVALALGISGIVAAGVSAAVLAWNGSRYDSWRRQRDQYDALTANGGLGPDLVARNAALVDRATKIQRADDVGVGIAVAAGGALVTAAILWFIAPRNSDQGTHGAARPGNAAAE